MEKEYKIEWLEKKTTSTGKAYYSVTLSYGENGETQSASIWSDFPNFANLMPGQAVTGELKKNDKGYWNLYPPRTAKTTSSGAYKQKMMEDTMKRKEDSIERFQDSKEESIKLASAQRDAVLIVTTMMNTDRLLAEQIDIKAEIINWRNWFLSDEFTDHPPF